MVMGVVLLLVGLAGFVSNPLVGDPATAVFGVNVAENVVHLLGGVLGIWLAKKGSAKSYNKWLGIIGVVLAVLGFIPGVKELLLNLFGINMAATYLHLGIGIVSLAVAYGVKGGSQAA